MLTQSDVLVLTAWCRTRDMRWMPARARGGAPSLLLEPVRSGLDAMLLVVGAKELRLLDVSGQELAAASDLPALLDAVDGGVADRDVPRGVALGWPLRGAALSRPAGAAA